MAFLRKFIQLRTGLLATMSADGKNPARGFGVENSPSLAYSGHTGATSKNRERSMRAMMLE